MVGWAVSPRSGVAFLDLTDGTLQVGDVGGLVGALSSYYGHRRVRRVVVRARSRRSAAMETLITNLKAQARVHEVGFEVQLDA